MDIHGQADYSGPKGKRNGSHNISYVRGEERGLAWGCEKRSHTYQAWPISLRCIGFQDNFLSSFILLPSLEPSRHIRT